MRAVPKLSIVVLTVVLDVGTGFSTVPRRPRHSSAPILSSRKSSGDEEKVRISSLSELESYFDEENEQFKDRKGKIDYDKRLKAALIEGDTQLIGSPDHPGLIHPVVELLHARRKTGKPDDFKVALVVEGGGMRGCLSAGMVAAIYYLGLEDQIDVVYGSSAGTVIGSYFITRQLQWFGPEIYYDSLTTAGRAFIDTRRLLRALGVGLVSPFLLKDVLFRRFGKPVLNLDFLLKRTMQESKPLLWDKFVEQQKKQPLKVVASSLKHQKSVVMDMEQGSFTSIEELAQCMHASCLLPGIAGPVMNRDEKTGKLVTGNKFNVDHYEPLADALLFEPLPYTSAIKEGATHVIVFRTRPDGVDVTGKSSLFEKMILKRFFLRKNKLPDIFEYMMKGLHKKEYGREVLELNEMAKDMHRGYTDRSKPHVMTVAVPPGSEEVARLEIGREAIFEGVRRGFARAYDTLVEDPNERGRGASVAREFFPDEILNYDPREIDDKIKSAFEIYLSQQGEEVEKWKIEAPYIAQR